jgi:hypothetical protein
LIGFGLCGATFAGFAAFVAFVVIGLFFDLDPTFSFLWGGHVRVLLGRQRFLCGLGHSLGRLGVDRVVIAGTVMLQHKIESIMYQSCGADFSAGELVSGVALGAAEDVSGDAGDVQHFHRSPLRTRLPERHVQIAGAALLDALGEVT